MNNKQAAEQGRTYKRDSRSPIPKSATVSRVMSANRGKNSKPEILLRKALWAKGVRGYRLHYKRMPGQPDLVFVSKKLAVFVHGCFWHRCSKCGYTLPKTNSLYWKSKFSRNVERDKRHARELRKMGWRVLVAWECDVRRSPDRVSERIVRRLDDLTV